MPALVDARPTIAIDGTDAPALSPALLSLHVREHVDGLASCELVLGNWQDGDFPYFDRGLLDFGKTLDVSIGSPLFAGRITGLEGRFPQGAPPALSVLAEDRLQDLRMTRRTRSFEQVSDADVASAICADHGLQADWSLSGPTHEALAQVNRSDLAFLRDRARTLGGELQLDGTTLRVRARTLAGAVPLRYGRDLREFTALADLAAQRTTLTVSGWDVAAKQAVAEEATASALGGEAAGGESGPSVLESSLGPRAEVAGAAVPLTADEARGRAEALLRRRARRFVCGRGVAEPNPDIRAGATVDLAGLGPLFSGRHTVVEVTHVFEGSLGARTEFVTERAVIGR